MKIVIEVDGETHAQPAATERDTRRTAWLATQGWQVTRFTNQDVMTNIEGVLTTLAASIASARAATQHAHNQSPTTQHPHPTPQPAGEAPPLQ